MGTAYIFITRSGVKRMLVNPSSTGKKFWPSFDVYIFGLLFLSFSIVPLNQLGWSNMLAVWNNSSI